MSTIHVDGTPHEVSGQESLLTSLLGLGYSVPYFCWHPAMGSVGACRLCAVKVFRDEADRAGRIVMSCMTPVTDGMRVSVSDPEVLAFRRQVIEWLMINHPHDCPVCDEGGECHLQDMTVACGHTYRRFSGRKRTYRNQDLGPLLTHEMNRCIQCYRCVRFYRDYAGGRDLEAFASKDHVYFGRHADGPLESEFSGNLVEVCPTGVFTDKTLRRHYSRKWDLETAPSVCGHCGLGCNTLPAARYGRLRRVRTRFNADVNGFFLCDRGRYGYEFVNDGSRPRRPLVAREEVSWDTALAHLAGVLGDCRVGGIGSPRASLEANFALKSLVGEGAFSTGMASEEHHAIARTIELAQRGLARLASLADVRNADAILILGADPTNEAPMLDLAIRRAQHRAAAESAATLGIPVWNDLAVRDAAYGEQAKLLIASSAGMKLDSIAAQSWRLSPPEVVALAVAAGAALDGLQAPQGPAGMVANTLASASRPLVIVNTADRALLAAAAALAAALSARHETPCGLSVVVPECNSMGVGLLGGISLDEMLDRVESGDVDTLVVVENDLFRRLPAERLRRALGRLRHLVVLDCLRTPTTDSADVVLPAAAVAESTGTLVSAEGRAQRFYQVFVPPGDPRASWRVLRDLRSLLHPESERWESLGDVLEALGRERPLLAGARQAALDAWRDPVGVKIARQTHRFSGRTAMHAHESVMDDPPPDDPDTPFGFTMEGSHGQPPAALVPRFWYPGANSDQSLTRFQIEVGGPLRGGPAGVRLLEPGGEATSSPPGEPAAAAGELEAGELWVVPRAVIFGSEECSQRSPGISELTPAARLRLHPEEARERGLTEGDDALLEVNGAMVRLPVALDATVARRVVIVPAGFPETAGITGVTRGRIGGAS